jgi:hypothetical protein
MPPPRSKLVTAALALLLLIIAALGAQLIQTLRHHQTLRTQLATLQNVKYGLLNADVWVAQVTVIIEKKINEYRLTPANRKELKATLEHMLEVLITQTDDYLRKQKSKQPLTKRIKESVRERLMDVDQVKAGIPKYADQILDEMQKPKSRHQLDAVLKNVLNEVSETTFAEMDDSELQAAKAQFGCLSRLSCQDALLNRIDANHLVAVREALVVLSLCLFLFIVVVEQHTPARLGLLALCCGVLMACGVLTPMIEVEARISSLKFVLLGEPVEFTDQVLYFQSKSVLDVVDILVRTHKADMVVVGVLVMTFSVVFPLAKLAASLVWIGWERTRSWRAVVFFALKSAKWSMADVFVVAMFMAYIGFNGVMQSQLTTFAREAQGVDVLTTNGTNLQIGFFMFLAYCMAALLTGTVMESRLVEKEFPAPEAQ